MNKNAKKWVAALRSGKYKQGKGALCKIVKGEKRYCCLGVACDLYSKEKGRRISVRQSGKRLMFSGYTGILPPRVRSWLGLATHDGRFQGGDLAYANDEGKRFTTIAKLIESEPEGLFA